MSNSSLITRNENILKFLEAKGLSGESTINNKKKNLGIKDSKLLQEELDNASNKDRKLRVGIIGRVKAGKSSLLNALVFDGRDILPKAATPMTAALTRMEYDDDVRAEIEFYDQEDIAEIKKKSREYSERFNKLKADHKQELERENAGFKKQSKDFQYTIAQINEMAERYAKTQMDEDIILSSAYDQYQRIEKANTNLEELGQHSLIKANSTTDLMGKLDDYVGSSGKYMPFTKSVKLYIPEEGLKDLEIVDTPGVNDPVQSREQRTSEFLAMCDVVLVVSPSGQFLSNEDMNLMSRVNHREGIEHIYIIASQVDTQFFGSEKNGGYSPLDVMNKLADKLDNHAKQVLSSSDLEKKVIELYKKNKIICTSSVAYTLHKHFDDQSKWDANVKHVWDNLNKHYPDSFSDPDTAKLTLKKLGEVDNIHKILDDVREKKDELLAERLNSLIEGTQKALDEFVKTIAAYIENRIEDIESKDLDIERKRSKELHQMRDEMEVAIKMTYRHGINTFGHVESKLHSILNDKTRDFTQKNQLDERTRSEAVSIKDNGLTNAWGLLGDRYRTETKIISEKTINAGQVKSVINEVRNNISSSLKYVANQERLDWEKGLVRNIFASVREVSNQNPDAERLNRHQVNATILNVFNQMPKASFELKGELPSAINKSGILVNEDARNFSDAADDYMHNKFVPSVQKDINDYVETSQTNLEKYDIAKNILDKLENDIKNLVADIENKEASIAKYRHMLGELAKLEKDNA